jgi:Tetratricopeptide repeat
MPKRRRDLVASLASISVAAAAGVAATVATGGAAAPVLPALLAAGGLAAGSEAVMQAIDRINERLNSREETRQLKAAVTKDVAAAVHNFPKEPADEGVILAGDIIASRGLSAGEIARLGFDGAKAAEMVLAESARRDPGWAGGETVYQVAEAVIRATYTAQARELKAREPMLTPALEGLRNELRVEFANAVKGLQDSIDGVDQTTRATHQVVTQLLDRRTEHQDPGAVAHPIEVGSAPPIPAGFQPRLVDRTRLDTAWHHGDPSGPDRGLVQLLTGDGGVGKTQLAADAHRTSTALMKLWIPATSLDLIVAGYAQAARQLRLASADEPDPEAADQFRVWMRGPGRSVDWILVLDDLDLTPAEVAPWWPPSDTPAPHGTHRVVVTLRRRDSYTSPDRIRVPLDVYSHEDAVAYLTDRIGPELGGRVPAAALYRAGDLVEALQRHPVALAQAASVIVNDTDGSHWTCARYLEAFRDQSVAIEQLFPDTAVLEPGARTVITTWTIAIDRATRDISHAARVADLTAYIDPEGAPEEIFTTSPALDYIIRRDEAASRAEKESWVRTALAALARYGLITLVPDAGPRALRVHNLAQLAARTRIPDTTAVRKTLAHALLEVWPDPEKDPAWAAILRANSIVLYRNWPELLADREAKIVLYRIGRSLAETANLSAGNKFGAQMLADCLRVLGPDHPDTLVTRHNLASWRGQAGDPAGAAAALEDLLADQLRILAPDDPDTLTIRHDLAYWRAQAGDRAAAAAALEDLLADQLRVLGPDHPGTLATRHDLASWRGQAGDPAGAAAALEDLLAVQLRVLSPDHLGALATRHDLASWRGQAGDPAGAAAALEDLLADLLRVLSPDHPYALTTRYSLAHWRWQAGDPAAAAAALEDLLADQLRVLGPDHPQTLATRHSLAHWRGQAGDPAAAAAALEDLLADRLRVLGPDHPNTLATRHSLVSWRGDAGDPAGAATALEDLLVDCLRVLGPGHAVTRAVVADLDRLQGKS